MERGRGLPERGGRIVRALACVLMMLGCATLPGCTPLVAAQTAGGNCDLSVRVRTSDEQSIEAQIQVDLLGPQGPIATVHIIGAEPAEFRVANGKTYKLTVSGTSIETTTTAYFEINPLEQSHTETVRVKVANQKPAAESIGGSQTISVSEMNIPKQAKAEMNKGLEAYAKGEMEKAAAHFEKAIAEYPRYARAYDKLGAIAMKSSDRAKARELFGKSIQADDAFLPAYVDLARMDLQDQDYAGSESLLTKALTVNPSMAEATALLATTEFANKEYDKALAEVQRVHGLPNHEQFAEVHIMAGKVLALQNRRGAAVEQFQLFLMEKPESAQGESVRKAIAELEAGQKP